MMGNIKRSKPSSMPINRPMATVESTTHCWDMYGRITNHKIVLRIMNKYGVKAEYVKRINHRYPSQYRFGTSAKAFPSEDLSNGCDLSGFRKQAGLFKHLP